MLSSLEMSKCTMRYLPPPDSYIAVPVKVDNGRHETGAQSPNNCCQMFGARGSPSRRSMREFKSSNDHLYALKEDLAEWLNSLYSLNIDVGTFMPKLETGVTLCRHANNVVAVAREKLSQGRLTNGLSAMPTKALACHSHASAGTFLARDNVCNFIKWCRAINVRECLLFETDDLVLRKNEKSFILCLLEVARKGAQLGMAVPLLVQMEQEIDQLELEEAALKTEALNGAETRRARDERPMEPAAQIITNDLTSLHERVVELLNRCSCPSQFPMIKMADGKYRIGDTKTVIFVRILRTHVMVRVGGGWDTLEHYLGKHDPCRCRPGYRSSKAAKLTMNRDVGKDKSGATSPSPSLMVSYNRYRPR